MVNYNSQGNHNSTMPDNSTCCKRTPSCCCVIATLVIFATLAIGVPVATQLMSDDTIIPPGASGPIDIHKSLVDQMSLLSISQEGSEGSEGFATSTWVLLIILCAFFLIFGIGYIYHLKIRLPKRRSAREEDRIQRERNDRNMAFLERLMQNENNPPPVWNSGKMPKAETIEAE